MTNREFWLKLFSENDVALIAAITLCQRFGPSDQKPLNESQMEYIEKQKKWLDKEASSKDVKTTFGEKAI